MYCNDISRSSTCRIYTVRTLLIACIWIIGFLFGCYLGWQLTDSGTLLIRNAVWFPSSFFSLYFVLFLPFVLSAIFIRISAPLLSLVVVFLKALSVGCCACGVIVAFSSAGWLIRSLLLFSDSLIVVLLLWFWIRNIAGDRKKLSTDVFLCAVISFIISCIDYFAVSAFLAALLNM